MPSVAGCDEQVVARQSYAVAGVQLALEKGEIDGDCGGWTSIPQDWLRDRKIKVLIRLSPTLAAGMDRDVPFAGDLLHGERDRVAGEAAGIRVRRHEEGHVLVR